LTDFPILKSLGYIIVTAAIAVLVLRRLRVPTIVAYMAAGLLLGPVTRLLTVSETVELISETGIALLLFLVGLELSLDHIRGVGRVAVLGGTAQILLTALAGWALAILFGLGIGEAVVLAMAITFSSTVVVVKLLGEKRALAALYGRIAVGILLVQDVAVVLALTVFAGLGGGAGGDEGGATAVATGLGAAFGGLLVLAAIAALAAKWVLPRLFGWASRTADTAFIWSLAWCFAFILAAELVHLSVELGAFIAGVSLAQLEVAESLRRRVQPIVTFFLAVFFVSLGLQMQPAAALDAWPLVLALSLTVLLLKPAILMATVPRLGYGERTSFLTSVTLGQMSEFSFILAALAAAAGILSTELLSVITVAGFITIGVSAYLVLGAERLYDFLRDAGALRAFRAGTDEPADEPRLQDHVIVIGMNSLGERIVRLLAERGERVLAIDTDATKLHGLPARTLLGTADDMAVLEGANYEAARLVVSALQIEDTNNLLAYRCRRAGVPASIHAFDTSLIDDLRRIGVEHIIVSKHDGTRQIAQRLRQAGVLD
jgi:Kef-type K+ transport system membrane component KefB